MPPEAATVGPRIAKFLVSGVSFRRPISIIRVEHLGSFKRSESNMATKKKLAKGKKASAVKPLIQRLGR